MCFYSYSSILFAHIYVSVPSVYSVGNRDVTSSCLLKHQEVAPCGSWKCATVVVIIGLVND